MSQVALPYLPESFLEDLIKSLPVTKVISVYESNRTFHDRLDNNGIWYHILCRDFPVMAVIQRTCSYEFTYARVYANISKMDYVYEQRCQHIRTTNTHSTYDCTLDCLTQGDSLYDKYMFRAIVYEEGGEKRVLHNAWFRSERMLYNNRFGEVRFISHTLDIPTEDDSVVSLEEVVSECGLSNLRLKLKVWVTNTKTLNSIVFFSTDPYFGENYEEAVEISSVFNGVSSFVFSNGCGEGSTWHADPLVVDELSSLLCDTFEIKFVWECQYSKMRFPINSMERDGHIWMKRSPYLCLCDGLKGTGDVCTLFKQLLMMLEIKTGV